MFDQQRKVNPECRAPDLNGWANHIRLMREVDNRTHRQMCELFKWAKNDSFWSANIQSPAKLREKWDTLTEKRMHEVPEPSATPAKKDWV